MRLEAVKRGQKLIDKVRFAWRGVKQRRPVTDIHYALFYRAEIFGRPFDVYWRDAQYGGPSKISHGDRQVLAAIASQANRCKFCTVSHAGTATRYHSRELVHEALADEESDVFGERLRALGQFGRKLASHAGEVCADDVRELLKQGISAADIEMTIHLFASYCIMNRMADALDFEVPQLFDVEVDPSSLEIRMPVRGQGASNGGGSRAR